MIFPDNKVHGANMGPTWGRQDPGGPHVDPMNPAVWALLPIISHDNADQLNRTCVFHEGEFQSTTSWQYKDITKKVKNIYVSFPNNLPHHTLVSISISKKPLQCINAWGFCFKAHPPFFSLVYTAITAEAIGKPKTMGLRCVKSMSHMSGLS